MTTDPIATPEDTAEESDKRSQPQRAYDTIKKLILDNMLEPGTYVLQEELGARLGVSRTPVREALIRLEREGLIEIRPRHGMRVLPVSIDAMREIYEVLTALEAEAARLAAVKGVAPELIADMEAAVDAMEQSLAADDRDSWAEADDQFHKLLCAASGNSRLIDMVGMVVDQAYRVRRLTLRLRDRPVRSNEDHRAVVAALKARDPDAAFDIHTRHRRQSGEMLIALLERLEIKRA